MITVSIERSLFRIGKLGDATRILHILNSREHQEDHGYWLVCCEFASLDMLMLKCAGDRLKIAITFKPYLLAQASAFGAFLILCKKEQEAAKGDKAHDLTHGQVLDDMAGS